MPKPYAKAPPRPKRFRAIADYSDSSQGVHDVSCVSDAERFARQAFKVGAERVTITKLRSAAE
jgi:hypothetical protein